MNEILLFEIPITLADFVIKFYNFLAFNYREKFFFLFINRFHIIYLILKLTYLRLITLLHPVKLILLIY